VLSTSSVCRGALRPARPEAPAVAPRLRAAAHAGAVRARSVNGNLNLSRAIGDLKYKGNQQLPPADQIITAQPDIVKVPPLGLPRGAVAGRARGTHLCSHHLTRPASLRAGQRGAALAVQSAARLRLPTAAPRGRGAPRRGVGLLTARAAI